MKNLALAIVWRFVAIFCVIIFFAYIVFGQGLKDYDFPNDYRGIIHLHSALSNDSKGKIINIVKAAENNNIDFVVVTDHWSPDLYKNSYKGFWENVLFIAGAEISKNDGITLIAIPLPKDFVPENDWRKNVISLRKKGSLALASHIEFSQTSQLVGVDGIEMTNLHTILVSRSYFGLALMWFKALWPKNWNLAFLFNSKTIENTPRWHYLNQSVKIPAFVGNDTHDNYQLFYKLGPKLGSYDNTFKLITTHIWANKLSQESVVKSIKKGQSYFAFEVFGNAKGFRFYATFQQVVQTLKSPQTQKAQGKQASTEIFLPGSVVHSTAQNEKRILAIQAPPHKDPKNTKLKILRDGKIVKEGTGILLNLENPKSGNYYAEIWKDEKPWIFSNPIKIQ